MLVPDAATPSIESYDDTGMIAEIADDEFPQYGSTESPLLGKFEKMAPISRDAQNTADGADVGSCSTKLSQRITEMPASSRHGLLTVSPPADFYTDLLMADCPSSRPTSAKRDYLDATSQYMDAVHSVRGKSPGRQGCKRNGRVASTDDPKMDLLLPATQLYISSTVSVPGACAATNEPTSMATCSGGPINPISYSATARCGPGVLAPLSLQEQREQNSYYIQKHMESVAQAKESQQEMKNFERVLRGIEEDAAVVRRKWKAKRGAISARVNVIGGRNTDDGPGEGSCRTAGMHASALSASSDTESEDDGEEDTGVLMGSDRRGGNSRSHTGGQHAAVHRANGRQWIELQKKLMENPHLFSVLKLEVAQSEKRLEFKKTARPTTLSYVYRAKPKLQWSSQHYQGSPIQDDLQRSTGGISWKSMPTEVEVTRNVATTLSASPAEDGHRADSESVNRTLSGSIGSLGQPTLPHVSSRGTTLSVAGTVACSPPENPPEQCLQDLLHRGNGRSVYGIIARRKSGPLRSGIRTGQVALASHPSKIPVPPEGEMSDKVCARGAGQRPSRGECSPSDIGFRCPRVNSPREGAPPCAGSARKSPPPIKHFRPKKKGRVPLPAELGVGTRSALLVQQQILQTRQREVELEIANASDIRRTCGLLGQLESTRSELLAKEILLPSMGKPLALPYKSCNNDSHELMSAAPQVAEEPTERERAHNRSHNPKRLLKNPQAVLERHRRIIFGKASSLDEEERQLARLEYLDVLLNISRGRVPKIMWSRAQSAIDDAREVILHRPSDQTFSRFQDIVNNNFTLMELVQWPVQEMLQRLGSLFGVTHTQLRNWIASVCQQLCSSHDYELHFRAVDRTIKDRVISAEANVCITLHRCRRLPRWLGTTSLLSTSPAPRPSSGMSSEAKGTAPGGRITLEAPPITMDTHMEEQHSACLVSGGVPDASGTVLCPLYAIRIRAERQTITSSPAPALREVSGHPQNEKKSNMDNAAIGGVAKRSVYLYDQSFKLHLYDASSCITITLLRDGEPIASGEFRVPQHGNGRRTQLWLPLSGATTHNTELKMTLEVLS